ncbi:MAG TPA: hypothetical protein VJV22_12325 [Acidobacteriaceae bacterium]|nr:hypothetical protein [Acidobacteriaceae bacterium]
MGERPPMGFVSRQGLVRYFFEACAAFCFAQRRFCAAAMRARASALNTRFLRGRFPNEEVDIREPPVLCSKARTFSRRLISSSTAAISSSRVIFFSLLFTATTYPGNTNLHTIANGANCHQKFSIVLRFVLPADVAQPLRESAVFVQFCKNAVAIPARNVRL